MRIRKRPPPTVVVARAVTVSENKPDGVPKPLDAQVQAAQRSGRLDGGSAELSPVVSEKKHIPEEAPVRHPNSEHVEEQVRVPNDINKQEKASSGGPELLMKSLVVVFERAGTRGLTAREAVAKLVEYDLPGLQGGERSSVQVAKVLRTPDFVHLEDGKYFIYPSTPHAVVAESSTQSEPSQEQETFQARPDISGNSVLHLNGSRRKRKTSVSDGSKENTTSDVSEKTALQLEEKIELKKRRRRPPSSQHELAIGPRQCKRYDGRGWQCTRETEEGLSFCEHHQALMNKRTLRLNLAKKRRKGGGADEDMGVEPQAAGKAGVGSAVDEGSSKSSKDQQLVAVADNGIEDLINNQRRRLVKARSLKSIK